MGPIHLASIQGHLLPHRWGEPGSEQHRAEFRGSVSLCVCVGACLPAYLNMCHTSTRVIHPHASSLHVIYPQASHIHRRHISTHIIHPQASHLYMRHTSTCIIHPHASYTHTRHISIRVIHPHVSYGYTCNEIQPYEHNAYFQV